MWRDMTSLSILLLLHLLTCLITTAHAGQYEQGSLKQRKVFPSKLRRGLR